MGQVVQDLMGHGRMWSFIPREMGVPEGCGQRRVGPQSGDHRCNGCCKKSHAVGVERMQVTTLVHVGHEGEDERDGHIVSSQ